MFFYNTYFECIKVVFYKYFWYVMVFFIMVYRFVLKDNKKNFKFFDVVIKILLFFLNGKLFSICKFYVMLILLFKLDVV